MVLAPQRLVIAYRREHGVLEDRWLRADQVAHTDKTEHQRNHEQPAHNYRPDHSASLWYQLWQRR